MTTFYGKSVQEIKKYIRYSLDKGEMIIPEQENTEEVPMKNKIYVPEISGYIGEIEGKPCAVVDANGAVIVELFPEITVHEGECFTAKIQDTGNPLLVYSPAEKTFTENMLNRKAQIGAISPMKITVPKKHIRGYFETPNVVYYLAETPVDTVFVVWSEMLDEHSIITDPFFIQTETIPQSLSELDEICKKTGYMV